MTAYYNELEPFAAQWLRNLVAAGHVAPGEVDDRTISDVAASDVEAATQAHFFAGVGVWSHALRLAGWPDDLPVWTGSCPCQPFSSAGRGGGFDDERHLWPVWFELVRQCRPPVVFCDWILCRDGRWRAVEPGAFPLAHGVAGRVGRLRAYGNAIVAPLAARFVEAAMGAIADRRQARRVA